MLSVLVLVGPTASGKSALAMDVARERGDIEIVAIDAFTIYKGMDIGTAKASAEDRAEVPHHMVDVLAPNEDVAVAWFRDQAREVINGILGRRKTPLLVGGSGLYFRAVVDPLDFPPTDTAVRDAVEAQWVADPRLAHAHLVEVDPEAAALIEPDNIRRVVRALEVQKITGRKFSSFRTDWDPGSSIYEKMTVARLDPAADVLKPAIDQRAKEMVEAGLVEECRALREQYGELSGTASQGIGYAEAFKVLDGEADAEHLASHIAKRTRNYARRQKAWFKRDPRAKVLTVDAARARLLKA